MSNWFDIDSAAALQLLKTDADHGLSDEEAARRLAKRPSVLAHQGLEIICPADAEQREAYVIAPGWQSRPNLTILVTFRPIGRRATYGTKLLS